MANLQGMPGRSLQGLRKSLQGFGFYPNATVKGVSIASVTYQSITYVYTFDSNESKIRCYRENGARVTSWDTTANTYANIRIFNNEVYICQGESSGASTIRVYSLFGNLDRTFSIAGNDYDIIGGNIFSIQSIGTLTAEVIEVNVYQTDGTHTTTFDIETVGEGINVPLQLFENDGNLLVLCLGGTVNTEYAYVVDTSGTPINTYSLTTDMETYIDIFTGPHSNPSTGAIYTGDSGTSPGTGGVFVFNDASELEDFNYSDYESFSVGESRRIEHVYFHDNKIFCLASQSDGLKTSKVYIRNAGTLAAISDWECT